MSCLSCQFLKCVNIKKKNVLSRFQLFISHVLFWSMNMIKLHHLAILLQAERLVSCHHIHKACNDSADTLEKLGHYIHVKLNLIRKILLWSNIVLWVLLNPPAFSSLTGVKRLECCPAVIMECRVCICFELPWKGVFCWLAPGGVH